MFKKIIVAAIVAIVAQETQAISMKTDAKISTAVENKAE